MPTPSPQPEPQSRLEYKGMHPDDPPPRSADVVPLKGRRRSPRDDRSRPPDAEMNAAAQPPARVLPLRRPDAAPWDDAAEPDADLDAEAPAEEAEAAAPRALHPDLDDAQLVALVERIVDRDERALEALYDATCARVHGLALRITQRRALAEEVVEDTYWQVWRQAPRFDAARGRAVTWLLAMARSRAIDALRRDQRFKHEELPEEGPADPDADSTAPPQDLLDATRGAAQLHAALAALEPRARLLVALAFFRGLTHEEIAVQAALPLGTVKSLIRRALLQLRQALDPHSF